MKLIDFEENIMRYLLFLVHVQQSVKIPIMEKINIFDHAKENANLIFSNIQKYFSNKNEYNSYDTKKLIVQSFNEIKSNIEKDINYYKKNITINDIDFSFFKIIDTLTDLKYDIRLTRDDIKKLLFYTELTRDVDKEKKEKEKLEDLRQKNDDEFHEIKRKTFLSMLNGNKNVNPLRFFDVNSYLLEKYKIEDIKYTHDRTIQITEGLYFIETQEERIIILNLDKRQIEYSFRIIDTNDSFIIFIQGKIKINESLEEYYINEQYPNNYFGKVINAYNLRKTIELFNELGKEENNEKNKKSNDIDDFLSGKII